MLQSQPISPQFLSVILRMLGDWQCHCVIIDKEMEAGEVDASYVSQALDEGLLETTVRIP